MNTVDIAQLIAQSGGPGKFEGDDHGSPVSFFFVTSPPGTGASKHRHPYVETFVVIEGEIHPLPRMMQEDWTTGSHARKLKLHANR